MIVLIASAAAVGSLLSAGGATNLQAFDFFILPFQLVYTIYGKRWPATDYEPLASWLVIVANVGWTLLFAGITWWRYRKLTVTK
ncbi:unannotated protein [freshwater metagenome]|uniref:Unannotated protein n=1 Tax=freshwater metagenome TaxID=449393 RepID=A0A6J7FSH1_9ZZZZ